MLYRLTVCAWSPDCSYPTLTHVFVGETQEQVCQLFEKHLAMDAMLAGLAELGALSCAWDTCHPQHVCACCPERPPTVPTPPGGERPQPPPVVPPRGRRPEAGPVRPPDLTTLPPTTGRRPEARPVVPPSPGFRSPPMNGGRTGQRYEASRAASSRPLSPLRPMPPIY